MLSLSVRSSHQLRSAKALQDTAAFSPTQAGATDKNKEGTWARATT